jgi:protein-S-isoprenylcysteine O-methyltransferase Ste14
LSEEKTRKQPPLWLLVIVFITLFILISIGITILFKLPWVFPFSRLWGIIIGSIFLGFGFYFLISAFWVLTSRRAFGKDIYKNQTESQLITRGIYAYTRNPLYIGVFLIFFGWFFLFLYTFLLFIPFLFMILFYFVSKWEERELTERFGEEYLRYKEAVPRFIPYRKKKPEETQ